MGEVRAKVKLTNAVDESLVRRGQLTEDQVRVYEADALVDTGAVRSVIPIHVVERLGLTIRGQRRSTLTSVRILLELLRAC